MSKVLLVVRTITKSIAGLAVMVGSFQMATSGLCDELSPIKPERVSSSVDDSYCSARYRDALSREDGTVLYVCGVAERERPAGVQYGHVIAIDRPDGSVRFYHVTGEAGVEPEDEVLYTVTEPHPAWGWCYDGTARSLVLVGYRKYGPTLPESFVRFYDEAGKLRIDFSRDVSRRVISRLPPIDDGERRGVVGVWSEEGSGELYLTTYEGFCLQVMLDTGAVEAVPLSDTIAAGIARRNQSAPPR